MLILGLLGPIDRETNFQAKAWNWRSWCWHRTASGRLCTILIFHLKWKSTFRDLIRGTELDHFSEPSVQAFQKLIYVSTLVFGEASAFLLPWKRVFKVTDAQVINNRFFSYFFCFHDCEIVFAQYLESLSCSKGLFMVSSKTCCALFWIRSLYGEYI